MAPSFEHLEDNPEDDYDEDEEIDFSGEKLPRSMVSGSLLILNRLT